MKNIYRFILLSTLLGIMALPCISGNKDRVGQAGAPELLVNPWARSAGWAGVNISNCVGLESMFSNVAGLAFTPKTEVGYTNTQWLSGSGVSINTFGLGQRINEETVLGAYVMAMGFGDIQVTTVNNPEDGTETFSPKFININLAYSRAFSNSIYGGFNLKIISENTSDLGAQGVAIDAGIQYVTGETDNIKFGISLKNIGPTLKFKGDGLKYKPGNSSTSVSSIPADFELPSQLNIGLSYAYDFDEHNKLTVAGAFTSNAFCKDLYILGLEYGLMDYLRLRVGYSYEDGITSKDTRTTVFTGFNGGASIQIPINKESGTMFAIDYAYRDTNPYKGTHQVGVRVNF